jgi:UDP-glucose 4-epimerase
MDGNPDGGGRMSRVLVTGAAGRLGRSVVDGLESVGHEVVPVDRTALPGRDHPVVDLTDAAATRALFERVRPEAVVHLAAIAVPFSAPEDAIFATNVTLAYRVLEAAVASGARSVVAASSPTVLGYGNPAGWLPARLPLDEDVEPQPWNAYALSKLVVENTVRMFARRHGDRARFASFRPCYVIAPEEWDGAPTQQGHSVRERLDDPALSAPALFNYVDARDAAGFVATLLDGIAEIPNGDVFFVSADDALARRPLSELLPAYVPGSELAAASLTGTAAAFSNERARRLLGWRPRHSWRTELVEALA